MKTIILFVKTILLIAFISINQYSYAQAPLNDECSGAVTINALVTCDYTFGTTVKATSSLSQDICSGELPIKVKDVWYKFTSDGSLSFVIKVKAIKGTLAISLYKNSCDYSSYVACANSLGDNLAQINVGVLPAGTYYYRIYSLNTKPVKFSTCVSGVAINAPESQDESSDLKKDGSLVTGNILIEPNPSDGVFTLSFFTEFGGHYYSVIKSSIGVTAFTTQGLAKPGWNDLNIDLSSFGSGIYSIAVKGEGIHAFAKALVQ